MKREKQQLIQDLVGGDEFRATTLLAGSRMLRRRRHWRMASRGMAVGLVLTVAAIWFERTNASRHSASMLAQAATPRAPAQFKAITDDQLLALFPDTPVGLVTLPDGHKRLVFPRAGDEQKFLTRL